MYQIYNTLSNLSIRYIPHTDIYPHTRIGTNLHAYYGTHNVPPLQSQPTVVKMYIYTHEIVLFIKYWRC